MEVLKNILNDCGLDVQHYERVHGGDINNAYCLFTSAGKYFLKVNDKNKYPSMFKKEANGLNLLRQYCTLIIPKAIKAGEVEDQQYLLMEWLEKGAPQKDMWKKFGQALALMHRQSHKHFGLDENNYIGSLKQNNIQHQDWHSFYAECRIMPLVKILFDSGVYSLKDKIAANLFCAELKNIFPGEPASLLHGDLWAGNYLIHSSGYAAIYDPAIYYGHREMDIGMTKLFGGFDPRFYDAYDDAYSLEKNWHQRLPYAQLYPLLVHAVLFGGHYIIATKNIFSLIQK
jgi:fructosamine-3-kinase